MEPMTDNQRLQLQNMIKANNVEDQTNLIRNLKHSDLLKNDINALILLKAKYRNEPDKINENALTECNFLFTYYTDIFNKVKKDEIDLGILFKFIDVLKKIENGVLDQHEGSFIVGTLLKELYIDSALKKADKLNEEHEKNNPKVPFKEPNNISWRQFKKMNDN
jgi:hypothetical protein